MTALAILAGIAAYALFLAAVWASLNLARQSDDCSDLWLQQLADTGRVQGSFVVHPTENTDAR